MDNPNYERSGDNVLHVEFYKDAIQNSHKTEKEGRPVFEDVDFVRIITPGDTKTIIETKVDETHKFRFKNQWKTYSEGNETQITGWILKEWPVVTASQVKELNYHNVYTVEQLSKISDHSINNLGMGMFDLRTKAKAALDAAAGSADLSVRAIKEQNQIEEIKSLKSQLSALNNLVKEEKRGRGRPRKE